MGEDVRMIATKQVKMSSDSSVNASAVGFFDIAVQRLSNVPQDDSWAVGAVSILLEEAYLAQCSDLLIGCHRDHVSIRVRREGILVTVAKIDNLRRDILIARLKVLAHLPAFKRHEAQDGRIDWHSPQHEHGRTITLRISFLPTTHGESIVVRYPESISENCLSLEDLGASTGMLDHMKQLMMNREGTLLITGPSSSGKTTTMYAMLEWLNSNFGDRLNMLTIEDPVERDLPFASQVQINQAQGLTFEQALRSAVRQDPNVLLFGEIRDPDSARIAIQAGMSGHLVITTLHAGRASRVFSRLLSMGIDPYLVASAVTGSVAQRLARRICQKCQGDGCVDCRGMGVCGRIGIFEVCVVTEALRELILARTSPARVAEHASQILKENLFTEGRRLIEEGQITRAEFEFLLAKEKSDVGN